MEQFSPEKSRIFAAAAIANIYSSLVFVGLRFIAAAILIILLLVFATSESGGLFQLSAAITIIFFVFEIFYRAKILKEKPLPLQNGQVNGLPEEGIRHGCGGFGALRPGFGYTYSYQAR